MRHAALFLLLALCGCGSVPEAEGIFPADEAGIYELALDFDTWTRANAGRTDASYVDEVLIPAALERARVALNAPDRVQSLRDYALQFQPTPRSNALAVVFMARVPELRDRGLTFDEVSRIIEALLTTGTQ